MKFIRSMAVALGSLALACSASATVVFENGSLDGTYASAQISPDQIVTDSFNLANSTVLTRATVGLWSPSNTRPENLTWSIGSAPFGQELASGTVLVSSTQVLSYDFFDVYLATFDLSATLSSGDFWLTLSNGTSTGGAALGWDINFGPSSAFYRNSVDSGPADSEYFKLEGTEATDPGPSPIPEPASLALFVSGLALIVATGRRKRRPV